MAKKGKEKPPAAKPDADPALEGEEGAQEAGKKKPPLKMMLIGGAAALVVLGGGGTAAALLLGGHKGEAHADAKDKKPHKAAKKGGEGEKKDGKGPEIADGPDGVVFYTLPDMVVNIQSADGRPTFLKLKLAFELPDRETAEALEPNQPRLTDMFNAFLRELRPEDLAGSQGSWQLRMELQRRVNLIVAPAKVNAVLIQEMLIQ